MKKQFRLKKNYGFLAEGTLLNHDVGGNYKVDASGAENIYCYREITMNKDFVEGRSDIFEEIEPTMTVINKDDLLGMMEMVLSSQAFTIDDRGGGRKMAGLVKSYLEEIE